MSKGMVKTTIREIKSSFGRYMAIFLIVALGVGFFAGLKVTHDVMVDTADTYLNQLHFYDYRLVSTLGFDEDLEETFEKEADVKVAEGSKSTDVLMVWDDKAELTLKTMAVPEKINLVKLEAGRMPEHADECVVDSHVFDKKAIGSTLKLSDTNDKDDLDKFKVKEFTIVGVVSSPLYIRYDRGTTSIGNGVLDAFVYIDELAYDMDYDTEIYVEFEKGQNEGENCISGDRPIMYSKEYEDFVEKKKDNWETLTDSVALKRYERLYKEASDDLDDAKKELEAKKKDGEKELSDAKQELLDGERKVSDGEAAIYKAKKEISDNEKKLKDSEEQYKKGLADYNKGKKEYDTGKKEYDKAKAQYDEEYAKNYPEYEKKLKSYNEGKAAYDQSENEYAAAFAEYEKNKACLDKEQQKQKDEEFAAWRTLLDETAKSLEAAKTQLDAAATEFENAKAQLEKTNEELAKAFKKLEKAKKDLNRAKRQISEGKTKLSNAKKEIALKEQDIATAKEKLVEGEEEYQNGKKEFDKKIADAKKELADAENKLEDFELPDTYVLGRDANPGYVNFETDSEIVMGIANVFPVFFFLVAALVCITTMTRMMEEQRIQVGVLKALGYSNGAIIGKYMTYSVSASLTGAVAGFFIGTWVFPWVIWVAYKMMYNMDGFCYVFDGKLAIIGILVAFLCSGGTTLVCCYQELSEMAASLMRPKTPKAGKRVLLERIPSVWSRMKFLDKVSVRNLFRYKKRFFMMIIGVSGCTALLVAAFGIKDSVSHIADKQFGEIFLYDMSVSIKEDADLASMDIAGHKEVEKCLPVLEQSVDMKTGKGRKSVSLLVPETTDDFDSYMSLYSMEGDKLTFPKDGAVIVTAKLAESYHIKPGDKIILENSDLKGGEVVVAGICENYFNHYILATENTYEALFDESVNYNEEFIDIIEEADAHAVAADFMGMSDVVNVSVSEDIRQNVTDMMSSLNYVVFLVIGCAASLAFIVIYNLNNINITERIREIATIKVLGFYKEETKSYIFRENVVLTLLGSLAGLILGHYLHAFIMSEINLDAISFDLNVRQASYLYSIMGTLLFNWLVNLFMSGKLEKVQMAESLKSVD